jgi:alkylhydroperoxidase family enzyme
MTYVTKLAEGPTELDRVWRLRSAYYELFMEDYNRSIERLDPVLIETCRLWMANLLGSKLDQSLRYGPALEAGLTEAKIKELPNYAKSLLFTERERVCLDLAEQMVIQSSNISDADVERLSKVMSWEDVIYFIKALNVMEQLSRSCTAFDIQPSDVVPTTMPRFQVASRVVAN